MEAWSSSAPDCPAIHTGCWLPAMFPHRSPPGHRWRVVTSVPTAHFPSRTTERQLLRHDSIGSALR